MATTWRRLSHCENKASWLTANFVERSQKNLLEAILPPGSFLLPSGNVLTPVDAPDCAASNDGSRPNDHWVLEGQCKEFLEPGRSPSRIPDLAQRFGSRDALIGLVEPDPNNHFARTYNGEPQWPDVWMNPTKPNRVNHLIQAVGIIHRDQ